MLVSWLSKACSLRRVDFDKLKTKFGWPLITMTEQLSLSKFGGTFFSSLILDPILSWILFPLYSLAGSSLCLKCLKLYSVVELA